MQDSHFLARRWRVEPGIEAPRSQRRREVVTNVVREQGDYRPSRWIMNSNVPEARHVGAAATEQLQEHILDLLSELVRLVENQHRRIEVPVRVIEGRECLAEDQVLARELFCLRL